MDLRIESGARPPLAYYVSAVQKSGYATVWRAYNTRNGTHFYTSGYSEYAALPSYYSKEGAAFCYPPAGQVVNRLNRWANNSSTWPLCRVYVNYSQLPADWRDAAYRSRVQWNTVGASNFLSDPQYDVESVITHELGHWVTEVDPHRFEEFNIGPDQSWPWATMYGLSGPGETHMRTLAAEDIDGIRSLYGRKP
jgi:hypothetical protein